MKKRLLLLSAPVSLSFNVLWTERLGNIQQKNNPVYFIVFSDTAIYDRVPFFIEGG